MKNEKTVTLSTRTEMLKRIVGIVDRSETEAELAYPDNEILKVIFFKAYLKSALNFLDLS